LRFTASGISLPSPLPESITSIPLNEWHHVAVTYGGNTLRFYLDGKLDGKHSLIGTLSPNDDPLNIGADFLGDDEYWNGRIDALMIWKKALSKAHIRNAMKRGFKSLAGYWPFDEGLEMLLMTGLRIEIMAN